MMFCRKNGFHLSKRRSVVCGKRFPAQNTGNFTPFICSYILFSFRSFFYWIFWLESEMCVNNCRNMILSFLFSNSSNFILNTLEIVNAKTLHVHLNFYTYKAAQIASLAQLDFPPVSVSRGSFPRANLICSKATRLNGLRENIKLFIVKIIVFLFSEASTRCRAIVYEILNNGRRSNVPSIVLKRLHRSNCFGW